MNIDPIIVQYNMMDIVGSEARACARRETLTQARILEIKETFVTGEKLFKSGARQFADSYFESSWKRTDDEKAQWKVFKDNRSKVCICIYESMYLYIYVYMYEEKAQWKVFKDNRSKVCICIYESMYLYIYMYICMKRRPSGRYLKTTDQRYVYAYMYIYIFIYICIYV
jgi:hypothetical protein